MPWLYGQTWLWYLIAFLVGVLLAWLLLVRPQQRRLRDAEPPAGGGTAAGDTGPFPVVTPAAARPTTDPARDRGSGDAVTERSPAADPALSTLDAAALAVAATAQAAAVSTHKPTAEQTAAVSTHKATAEPTAAEPTTPGEPGRDGATPSGAGPTDAPREDAGPENATPEQDAAAHDTAAHDTAPHQTAPEPTAQPEPAAQPAAAAAGPPEEGAPAAPAVVAGRFPGSARSAPDGSAPSAEFTVKGNANSMLYHTPSSPYYLRTRAEAWFRSTDDAEAAGFTGWRRR